MVLLLVVFSPLPLAAADPLERPLSFQHLTVKDGLFSEMVYAVTVRGNEVWLGTYAGGVTLWDRAAKKATVYTTKGEPQEADDGNSIKWKNHPAYNHVWVMLPDRDRLWFGTYFYGFGGGGISYYNPKRKNPWRLFDIYRDRAKKVVSLAAEPERLWVGSEKGLSVLDKKTEKWTAFYAAKDGLAGNFVNALLLDGKRLWIGTNAGITVRDLEQNTFRTYGPKEGVDGLEIKSLLMVRDRIWAGTVGGELLTYDPATDRWRKLEAPDPLKGGGIHSLAAAGRFVLVCRDNGVSVHDPATGRWGKITRADGLPSDTVFAAAADKDGIWFGTDQGASLLLLKL
jgi:ligand-binding sensor domain-containing protein